MGGRSGSGSVALIFWRTRGALSGERARFAFDEGADELGKSGSAAHARFIHTFEL